MVSARDVAAVFVGPEPCPNDASVLGYHNTTTLTNDMFLMSQDVAEGKSSQRDEYVFTLCPQTEFDLGTDLKDEDEQKETPIIPFFDSSTFRCGQDGTLGNDCVIKGGYYQVIFDDDFWWLHNVTFSGVTFKESQHVSVLGFGQPLTDITFKNCRWKDNYAGEYLVAIYWDKFIRAGFEPSNRRGLRELAEKSFSLVGPIAARKKLDNYYNRKNPSKARVLQGETSMFAGFTQCEFVDNILTKAGILNQGGRLELNDCAFQSNRALVVVANIQDAALTMRGSTLFSQNYDKYGPVFLDSSSELKYLSTDLVGQGNVGTQACQGIFVEKSGFDCLFSNDCEGSCCEFGLSTCDEPAALMDEGKANSATWASDQSGGRCGPGCVAVSIIVPLVGIVMIIWGVRYAKRRQSSIESPTIHDSEPAQADGAIYML